MSWLKSLLKKNKARKAVVGGLTSAAASPDSGTVSTNNSKAASAAAAELAEGLGFVLDDWDGRTSLTDHAQLHLEQLSRAAAGYSNCRLPDNVGEDWACTPRDRQLLRLSAGCAAAVYHPNEPFPEAPLAPELLEYSTPSWDATHKAFAVWYLGPSPTEAGVLVVAVRGTAPHRDHTINVNSDSVESGSFINLPGRDRNQPLLVHTGFLNAAKALAPKVQSLVDRHAADQERPVGHILFTGHSAGAAVSSLLFLHFITKATAASPSSTPPPTVSLVTYASPPVTSIAIPSAALPAAPRIGLCLAFTNEHDYVVRADAAYTRSLVSLYRLFHERGPSSRGPSGDGAVVRAGLVGPARYATASVGTSSAAPATIAAWPLPVQTHLHVGDVIVLAKRRASSGGGEPELRARAVRSPDLEQLLFVKIEVHKMAEYLARVTKLVS